MLWASFHIKTIVEYAYNVCVSVHVAIVCIEVRAQLWSPFRGLYVDSGDQAQVVRLAQDSPL